MLLIYQFSGIKITQVYKDLLRIKNYQNTNMQQRACYVVIMNTLEKLNGNGSYTINEK